MEKTIEELKKALDMIKEKRNIVCEGIDHAGRSGDKKTADDYKSILAMLNDIEAAIQNKLCLAYAKKYRQEINQIKRELDDGLIGYKIYITNE